MSIQILPPDITAQIAAGEVVDRPASAVKELLENALDAGARTITLEVEGGGRRLIRIADDGSGIPAAEVPLAFARHATSKLRTTDDLLHIATLGFRGEALASIAAVAHVTLTTAARGETAGTRVRLEGGTIVSRESIGAPSGTIVAVENLFYNVPARLKFLKSEATEHGHIDGIVTRYALAYPDRRFRVYHDGRKTFEAGGSGQLYDVAIEVYGLDTAREMLRVYGGSGSIHVAGYVSPPHITRANRGQITLFVNGRWVQDQRLTHAIVQAYHTLLQVGRYPLGVVLVTLPPEDVDVNIHPTKAEVRFRDGDSVFSAIQKAVRATLIAGAPIPEMQQPYVDGGAPAGGAGGPAWTPWAGGGHDAPAYTYPFPPSYAATPGPLPEQPGAAGLPGGPTAPAAPVSPDADLPAGAPAGAGLAGAASDTGRASEKLPILRLIGQIGAAYLVAEGPEGLYLIDQHAAHERVLYEQFMAEREQQAMPAQALLEARAVEVPPDRAAQLEAQLPLLNTLGFAVEAFGGHTFLVRAVPAALARQDPAVLLNAIADELDTGRTPLERELERRLIVRVCKQAAVKAGQTLSQAEMQELLARLEACASPRTCPHGRPTVIHFSAGQLAREFGRT
jgi:DNA mismatch repair protein MutL